MFPCRIILSTARRVAEAPRGLSKNQCYLWKLLEASSNCCLQRLRKAQSSYLLSNLFSALDLIMLVSPHRAWLIATLLCDGSWCLRNYKSSSQGSLSYDKDSWSGLSSCHIALCGRSRRCLKLRDVVVVNFRLPLGYNRLEYDQLEKGRFSSCDQ